MFWKKYRLVGFIVLTIALMFLYFAVPSGNQSGTTSSTSTTTEQAGNRIKFGN